MRKHFLYIAPLLLSLSLSSPKASDIIVALPMTEGNTLELFEKVVRLIDNMRENQIQRGDTPMAHPFKGAIPNMRFTMPDVGSAIPTDSNSQKMMQILRASLGNSGGVLGRASLSIEGIEYALQGARIQVSNVTMDNGNPVISGTLALNGLRINVRNVRGSLQVPVQGGSRNLEVSAHSFSLNSAPDLTFPVQISVKVDHDLPQKRHLKFQITSLNLASLVETIGTPGSLEINTQITAQNVTLNIGQRRVVLDIAKALNDNKAALIDLLKAQAMAFLSAPSNIPLASINSALASIEVPRDFWIKFPDAEEPGNKTLAMKIRYENLSPLAIPRSETPALRYDLAGAFCLQSPGGSNFVMRGENMASCQTPMARLSHTLLNVDLAPSERVISRKISADPARKTAVISISQNYINDLINTTVEAGAWAAALRPNRLTFAQRRAFVRFDEEIDPDDFEGAIDPKKAVAFYLDLEYEVPDGIARWVAGSKVRFPVRLYGNVKIEPKTYRFSSGQERANVPHIAIYIAGADCVGKRGSRCILEGSLPHGLVFSGQRNLFRGAIIQEIGKSLRASLDTSRPIFELPLPDFPNLGLEEIELELDQQGRAIGAIELD